MFMWEQECSSSKRGARSLCSCRSKSTVAVREERAVKLHVGAGVK